MNPSPSGRQITFWTWAGVFAAVVILASVVCKLCLLHSRELWLDETFSAYICNLSFPKLIHTAAGDVHPVLYYLLLKLWIMATGDAEYQLRLFSVLIDLAAMIVMAFLGRRLLGGNFGALATALFALSPILVVYSLEVRGYMLLILVFVSLLLAHWRLVFDPKPARGLIVAEGWLAGTLFYTHYVAIFLLIGIFAHGALLVFRGKVPASRMAAVSAIALLLIVPGIPTLLSQHAGRTRLADDLKNSHSDPQALSFGAPELTPTKAKAAKDYATNFAVAAGFFPAKSPAVFVLCAIPLVLVLGAAAFLWLVRRDEVCLLCGILELALAAGLLVMGLITTRYMLPVVPLVAIAVARAVQYAVEVAHRRTAGLVAAGCIVAVYVAGFGRQVTVPHAQLWHPLIATLRQNYQPEDTVIFSASYAEVPFDYFATHENFHPRETGFPTPIFDWWNSQKFKGWGGPVITQPDLRRFVSALPHSQSRTLWLVLFETYYYDPKDELVSALGQIGDVTEIRVPGDSKAHSDSPPRLIRVQLR